jgi:hypothetical protein
MKTQFLTQTGDVMASSSYTKLSSDGGSKGAGRKLITGLFALLSIALFIGVVVFGYKASQQGGTGDVVPLLKASADPVKVAPDEPGGMDVPDQDKEVFNAIGSHAPAAEAENLVAEPVAPELPDLQDDDTDTGVVAETVSPPAAGQPEVLMERLPEQKTVVKKVEASKAVQPVSAEPVVAEKPAPAVVEPAKEPVAVHPEQTLADVQQQVEQALAQPETPPAAPQQQPAPAAKEGKASVMDLDSTLEKSYRIQLGSLKDRASAVASGQKIFSKNKELLSAYYILVEEANLGAKGTYYRVQVGPFENKAAAGKVCDSLKGAGQDCMVVSPK